MRIGVAGAAGRMGRLVVEEIRAAGAELAGGTVRPGTDPALPDGVVLFPEIDALAAQADAVIDFTNASTVSYHARALRNARKAWILGSSGLSAGDEAAVVQAAHDIPIVYAANFSPGVTVMMMLAEQMASLLPESAYDADILEIHHRQKRDAPSGTAIALARAVARGRRQDPADVLDLSPRCGITGPRRTGAIGFAAIRGGQEIGEHSLFFLSGEEHLVLRHHALDRHTYARGAVQAALWLQGRSAGVYGMRDVIGCAPCGVTDPS